MHSPLIVCLETSIVNNFTNSINLQLHYAYMQLHNYFPYCRATQALMCKIYAC